MPPGDGAIIDTADRNTGVDGLDVAGRDMASSTTPAAGGFLIMLGALGGAAIGFALGQATAGFLTGIAIGIAAAVAVWLIDRRG